jgi:hypothetical protein
MSALRVINPGAIGACVLGLFLCAVAGAVEVADLKGFEQLFGRYAPGGDCGREPRVVVDVTGFTFEVAGARDKATRPEYAASYGGQSYDGVAKWFFPFRNANGYPILLAFNDGEKPGVLGVTAHDEGWKGGPKLAARHQALVNGSPYTKCR